MTVSEVLADHEWGTVAQLLALLALPPHSKKDMGSIPAWAAVGSVGQVLPRVHSAQVGYLPGLSVWSLHVLPVPAWVYSGYSGFPHHHKDIHCII